MSKKYLSEFNGGFITPAQYIMEQFLTLLAKQKHSHLPPKFWELDEYKNLWKRHVRSVHNLLKIYDDETIIAGLRDPKLVKIRTLDKAGSWLWKPIFDKYQERIKRKNSMKDVEEEENLPQDIQYDYTQTKKTTQINEINRLRNLDNES